MQTKGSICSPADVTGAGVPAGVCVRAMINIFNLVAVMRHRIQENKFRGGKENHIVDLRPGLGLWLSRGSQLLPVRPLPFSKTLLKLLSFHCLLSVTPLQQEQWTDL